MSVLDDRITLERVAGEILNERGQASSAGACWVTLSDNSEICPRDLDFEGCTILQDRARLKTAFYNERFCP
jgi:hypothetical protein